MRFKCPISGCSCSYKRKGDLKVHVKAKHPERPEVANKIAAPKSSKEGKQFPCPYYGCPCGYLWKKDLLRHLKNAKHGPVVTWDDLFYRFDEYYS